MAMRRKFANLRTTFAAQARYLDSEFEFSSETAVGPITIDRIAAQVVTEILKIQPSGPYNLCGYSFGGLVAFAAAMRLREIGREVGHLTLIATPVAQICWPMSVLARSLFGRVRRFARRGVRGAAAVLAAKAARARHVYLQRMMPAARSETPTISAEAAIRHYRPGFYPGRLTFIQSAHDKEFWCDFGKVWLRHAEAVEVYTLPTSHVGPTRDPMMVRQVADLIDSRFLEGARRRKDQSKLVDPGTSFDLAVS